MTNKIALVLISLFLITHCAWSMDFKNHPDYKLILKEAELGDNLVRSGKIYQALEYINVDSLSEKTKLEDETNKAILDEGNFSFRENYKKFEMLYFFKNNKVRLIEKALRMYDKGKRYFNYNDNVFDGEITLRINLDSLGAKGTIEALGDIYEGNVIKPFCNPLYYGYLINGMNVSFFLSRKEITFYEKDESEKITNLEFLKNQTIDGNNCIVIKGSSLDKNIVKLWLDSEKLYRPIKIEMEMKDKIIIIENRMAKYDKDICFPEKTIITEFYRDEISNSFLPDTKFILTVHKNSKININLSDSIFNSPIPDGATVGDHRTNETFIKGLDKDL